MPFPTRKLLDWANDFANEKQHSIPNIEKEIADIEARKLEKQSALHSARLAHERASKFSDILSAGMVCPRCWIESESVRRLHPRSGTNSYDIWRCSDCHFELQDEFRK